MINVTTLIIVKEKVVELMINVTTLIIVKENNAKADTAGFVNQS
jgi:hypothetical protein